MEKTVLMKAQTCRLDLAALKGASLPSQPHGLLNCLFKSDPLNLSSLSVNTLVLQEKPLQQQTIADEEDQLWLLLMGHASVWLSSQNEPQPVPTRLEPGAIAYQPTGTTIQIQTVDADPAVMLVVRWIGTRRQRQPFLAATIVPPSDELSQGASDAEYRTLVFDAPTHSMKRLHCFFLTFLPGATVPVHQHRDHDVLLIGLTGEIETHNERLPSPSVAYYRGGEPHGIRGVGQQGAKALAIEFYRDPPLSERLRTKFRETGLWQTVRALRTQRSEAK